MTTRDEYRQYQQKKSLLQAQLVQSRERLERAIEVRAILKHHIQQILQAVERHERHRVLTTGEVEGDAALQMLQQQLVQVQKKLAVVEQAIARERMQVRKINRALWQLLVRVEQFKRHQVQASKVSSRQPDLLQGHVVPSYKASNPLRELRESTQGEGRNVALPFASIGLLLEIAISTIFGLSSLALLGGLTLMVLWLLVPVLERVR